MIIPPSLPQYPLKIRQVAEKKEIFDPIRKKFVAFSKEEYVRQCLVCFLLEAEVPAGLISIEKEIEFNQTKKRYDLVVFSSELEALLLAECKAPEIPVNSKASLQAGIYHSVLHAGFIVLTNGPEFRVFKTGSEENFKEIFELPPFREWNR